MERCLKTAADTVFHTSVRAAASDFMKGTELTLSSARFAMAAAVGVFIGPSLTTRFLYPVFQNARLPQGVNMCVMSALAAFFAFSFSETLEPEHRKPMDWSRANPLSFFRMLRTYSGEHAYIMDSHFHGIMGLNSLLMLPEQVHPTRCNYTSNLRFMASF